MGSPEMDEALQAQTSEEAMNLFIQQNKRFIIASAYRCVKHFVTESDDEWSIALIAFHEAVKAYDSSKGDFHAFASVVIQRRLMDYLRSEQRHSSEIPVEPWAMSGELQKDDTSSLHLEIQQRQVQMSAQDSALAQSGFAAPGSSTVKDEIEALGELLNGYGFSFFDLADCSPKADKTKKQCALAVAAILGDERLFRKMRETKALPVKEILAVSDVKKKILERHRKYIIAAAEILNGEYPLLAEYMNYIRKQMNTS